MKQVDFYLISSSVKQARYKLACRLAGKLQKIEKSLLLVTHSSDETKLLDELMWAYSDTSFVAHEIVGEKSSDGEAAIEAASACTVHIAQQQLVNKSILERNYDVLVNLCDDVPAFNHHFDRIAEIIDADENSKVAGRSRYSHYKTEGFDLQTHNVSL